MRARFALAALVAALPFLAPSPALAGGNVLDGQLAPEIHLTDGLNGVSAGTTLASLRGKVVLLKFWLTHCPICRGTLPEFQGLHDRFGRSGVVCLSVVIDSAAGVTPYVREQGFTFPVGCDPDGGSSDRYGVHHFPGNYIIGVDGVVRASNGFPRNVIEEELRKYRVAELGPVPAALNAARDLVEDGDYGGALRAAEAVLKADGAAPDVKAAVARLATLAQGRQDIRFARAEAFLRAGARDKGIAELTRILEDFKDTSLEARARERLSSATGGR